MAAGWLHKVGTGCGSDRVVAEMLDYGFDPVATASGSDFV